VLRLPSFPNSASTDISMSYILVELEMEWNKVQRKGKGGKLTQFSQFRERRDVNLLLRTRNRMEWNELQIKGKCGEVTQLS
jgi:hypothetical protein